MNMYKASEIRERSSYQNMMSRLAEYVQNMVDFGIADMDEEARKKIDAKIQAKLEAGKRLTTEEMRYLRRYNPGLYAVAMRVEAKRKSVEERLKHAHSKSEVEQILGEALSSVRKTDPAYKYIVAAVMDTVKEFKKTDSYRKLPQIEEKGKKVWVDEKDVGAEEDSTGQKKATITYEFTVGAYQMAYLSE